MTKPVPKHRPVTSTQGSLYLREREADGTLSKLHPLDRKPKRK